METLFGKPADRGDGGLLSQRTIFPEFRIQVSFMLKGEGVWQVVAIFLVPLFLQLSPIGLVTMFL